MSQQDLFDRAVVSLSEAALDESRLPDASRMIDEACGTVGNSLVVYRGKSADELETLFTVLYYRGEIDEEINRLYCKHYIHGDERIPYLLRQPDGRLNYTPDIYDSAGTKTSPTYNELLRMGQCQAGLNTRMGGGLNGSGMAFILCDPCGKSDGWSSDQIRTVKRLLPHVRQLVRVRQVLLAAEEQGQSRVSQFGTRIGVVHLDRNGSILEANDSAREILRNGDGLRVRGQFLCACSASEDDKLGKLIAGALPRINSVSAGASLALERGPGLPRIGLHAVPIHVPRLDFGIRRTAAIILIVDPLREPRITVDHLGAVLGLTPSESQVAALLSQGHSVTVIARMTRRKVSSVRWLLKQAFAKLGISRQAELVRLVLSTDPLEASDRQPR